jgi:hypothetical protein
MPSVTKPCVIVADTYVAERHMWCAFDRFFDSSFEASGLLVDKELENSKKARKDVL